VNDFRLAIRALRAAPLVSVVAVLSLGLGIGASTAIFSIVDSLLLRALPVERPDRLVLVRPTPQAGHFWDGRLDTRVPAWSNPLWEQIRERRHELFETAFAFSPARFDLAQGGETDFAEGLWVSGGYFGGLGVPPMLGRTITAEDDQRGGWPDGPVAVLSYSFWQRRFGGSADAIGKTLTIERVPFTIAGVMPPGFFGADVGSRFDIAVPLSTEPLVRGQESHLDNLRAHWVRVMARLKDGQTLEAAEEALRVAQPRMIEATVALSARQRERYLAEPFALQAAAGGTSSVRASYGRSLLLILGVVVLVLLIACANIANLLLARTAVRRREFSVRLALGAPRWRLARQLGVESLLLAGAGALAGLAIAHWGSRLLVGQLSTHADTVFLDVGIDWRVLAFTAVVAAGTALLFGLGPALSASSTRPIEAMRESSRVVGSGRRVGVGNLLVAAQVAFSLVLLVAAGLFVRTLATLATRDLGFERDPVLLANLNVESSAIEPAQRLMLYERVEQAVRAMPGVAQAAISGVTPVSGMVVDVGIEIENPESENEPGSAGRRVSYINALTPGWFAAYGTPIVAGRDFDARDRSTSTPVAIVNEEFVRRFLPGGSPIGRRVRNAQPSAREQAAWMEVVGVVGDAAYLSLREEASPTLYVPVAQQPEAEPAMTLSLRAASGVPASLARGIAETIARIDPDIAITFTPLRQQVDAALVRERLVAMLSGFFGAVALLLAGLGLYGVTSYSVNRRRAEIGIRMALGAAPAQVVRFVLSRAWVVVSCGVLAGVGVSLWASRFVAPLLYGLDPGDPATLVVAAAVLWAVGALAGWLPARRASRIDPADVLRDS
jgi:predicted permease